jgi:hypothetical protein
MRQSNLRFWPSRRSGSDHRVPEEHSKKTNHNNAQDKAPRVAKTSCVVGSRPVGIAHAKLLGRPPASQPHQTLIKYFLNLSVTSQMLADAGGRLPPAAGSAVRCRRAGRVVTTAVPVLAQADRRQAY